LETLRKGVLEFEFSRAAGTLSLPEIKSVKRKLSKNPNLI
jgi:hypothetical protein